MSTRRRKVSLFLASIVPFSVLLFSCGARPTGWGVILWGDAAGPAVTGTVVGILKHSQIDDTYFISVPGEPKPREVATGKIRLFPRRADANAFAQSLSPYLGAWAFSQKEDSPPLPIREEAKPEAKTVYRLKPGQMVKIIGRSEQKAAVKPFEDFWYEVATEDGFSGWCFGHYLKVFTATGDPTEEAKKLMSQDETLDKILGSTWRPGYFLDEISSATIDLARFREDIGFFPNPSDNIFRLVLPLYSLDFHYSQLERVAAGNYMADGTDLRIAMLDDERITIRYRYKNQAVDGTFVIVKDDVAALIAAEQKRRQDIFDALKARGGALASSAYGTIRLEDGMRFMWEGFDRLVPIVIGPGAQGTGRIDFSYRLSKDLQDSYEGVITFLFDDAGGAFGAPNQPQARQGPQSITGTSAVIQGVSFLYKTVSGGVRLTSLSPDSFRDIMVLRPSFSPVIIFFTQSQSP